MKLVLDVQPERFESMIARLDHRVVQAWAADYMNSMAGPTDYRKPLEWIAGSSCDDLIAVAIVHTLNIVNRLDRDRHYAERVGEGRHGWRAEFRQPPNELDRVATALLSELADRLGALDSIDCGRWVGELLSRAPNMLDRGDGQGRPRRVGQLEDGCTAVLARVAVRSWSDDLRAALISGLRLNTRGTWARHIVNVALAVCDSDGTLANEMFRVALEPVERQVVEESGKGQFYDNWSDWHYREWTNGLGVAIALGHKDIDLVKWVSDRCRPLPLSVWDVEADSASFYSADPVAQFWFLVAFHAIVHRDEAGLVVDRAEVRALAELLWSHCHFVGQYLDNHSENSVAAEYAARCAIEYGEPSGGWLLDQVDSREVGPRALSAIMSQRARKRAREQPTDADSEAKVTIKFLRVASVRFGDGSRFGLEDLKYWSDLWLLLEAAEEAERTAKAMLAILPRDHESRRVLGRVYEITVLKLLSLVATSTIKLSPAMERVVTRLYRDLWADSYIPEHERTDRRQIDEWLSRSALSVSGKWDRESYHQVDVVDVRDNLTIGAGRRREGEATVGNDVDP